MKLDTQFTTQLKEEDHWSILQKLEDSLMIASKSIGIIHKGFDGIAQARAELASELARIDVIKEIVRLKLSVMGQE